MLTRRRGLRRLVALLAASLLALTACGGGGGGTPPATDGAQGDDAPGSDGGSSGGAQQPAIVRMAITGDEGALNPYTYVTGYPGYNLMLLVYDALFQLDAENVPQPWLVSDYQVDDTGTVWSFTLHEGITWHDGEPLTAEDVKFSYEYYTQYRHSRWTRAVSVVESIEVQDERSFTFKLSRPVPSFAMATLAEVPIIPQHIWQDVTEPDTFTDSTGSGPFVMVDHIADQSYRLVANENYFRGRPKVDELHISIIEDQTATFTALRVGEIDVASRNLAPELAGEFANVPDVEVVTGPGFTSTLLLINTEREPFDDQRARQAISLAIDPVELVDVLLLGYGTPGSPGFIHPALPHYRSDVVHRTDRARAAELWSEVGTDEVFELLVYSNNPIRVRAAEIIAEWLAEVGMNVEVKALDQTTVDSLVWPDFDVTKGRDFDLALWGWSAPVMVDQARLGTLFHSDLASVGATNLGNVRDQQLDELVDQLAVTTDPDAQRQILGDLQVRVAEVVPFVTLFYQDGIYAYRPAAYDGWVYVNGQGIVGKLSFVEQP